LFSGRGKPGQCRWSGNGPHCGRGIPSLPHLGGHSFVRIRLCSGHGRGLLVRPAYGSGRNIVNYSRSLCIFAPLKKTGMKRILIVLFLGVMVVSCKKEPQGNMLVTGEIEGLKKGTLYLQQFRDSSLVVLDSLEIR